MDEDEPAPVSARKLEELVRVSEASARIRLSDTIEPEDAERVMEGSVCHERGSWRRIQRAPGP